MKRLRLTGFDHRSLAAFRIAFGLTLVGNLWIRSSGGKLDAHYTDQGMVPVWLARLTGTPGRWSLLDAFADGTSVRIAFAAILVVYLAYIAGLFTRVMQLLVIVALVSLYHRNPLVDDGSDCAVRAMAIWTAFLPLGARFSLDVRWRGKPPLAGDHRSMAVVGILVCLALDYFLNAFQKDTGPWRHGTVFRNVLWDPWIASPIAVWMRPHMTPGLTKFLSHGARAGEYFLAGAVLLSPLHRWIKRATVVGIVVLHGGIALLLLIGSFSLVYLSAAALFVPAEDWDRFARFAGARPLRRARRGLRALALDGLALGYLWFALGAAAVSNPLVPQALKTFVTSSRSQAVSTLHWLVLAPNEWFKFRIAPRNYELAMLEVETDAGEDLDYLRGGPFDLERPVHASWHVGKYWVSYLWRVRMPLYDRAREQMAKYLYAHGVARWRLWEVRVVAPRDAADQPESITPRLLYQGERPTLVDLRAVVERSQPLTTSNPQLLSSVGGWVGADHILLRFPAPGEYAVVAFPFDRSCVADVTIHYTLAPDYGAVALSIGDDARVVLSGWSPVGVLHAESRMGLVPLVRGENQLRVEALAPLGPDAGMAFGLDALEVSCIPEPP